MYTRTKTSVSDVLPCLSAHVLSSALSRAGSLHGVSIVPVPGPTGATGPTGPIGPTGPTGTAPAPQALYAVAPRGSDAGLRRLFPYLPHQPDGSRGPRSNPYGYGSGDFILTQPGSWRCTTRSTRLLRTPPPLASVQLNANGTPLSGLPGDQLHCHQRKTGTASPILRP